MTRMRSASALVLALCALLGACGQKGALYLPDEQQEAVEQRETSDTPQREDAGR
jgi:predicted small lipoprotein YifL